MSPAKTTPKPAELAAEVRAPLDAAIADLQDGTRTWAALTLDQRARLLDRVRAAVVANADEWADAAALSKGLEPGHPLRGEEWMSGPYAALGGLDGYISSLRALARGASPIDGVKTSSAPGDRVRIEAFPASGMDRVLLSGFTGELWLQPGATAAQARSEAGLGQLRATENTGVGLVLGAGNITSIPFLDVLYELIAENRVSILKVNPTQDAVVPVFERALAPLIELGLLRIVQGGGDVGAYLTQHPSISHVHITGSALTFDAIVWGVGAEAAKRRTADDPKLGVPITAELGGVSPIIVVPGAWTDADLKYQAEHVVTMRMHNCGHNCIAGQVVILSSDWPQRDAFIAALKTALEAAPQRPVWYPRSDERLNAAASDYPDAWWNAEHTRTLVDLTFPTPTPDSAGALPGASGRVGPGGDATALETTEFFSPVLGIVQVPGTGQEFLDNAVAHANEKLAGTLGANVLIDPATETALGSGFERAIADLRYGGIAINTWTGVVFATPILSWGAFPGGTLQDVQSGLGVVHNTLLLDRVERSILRGPFRPFPRAVGDVVRFGSLSKGTVLPKPPWFVDAKTGASVGEGLTRWHMTHSVPRLVATLTQAMRS